jgi:type I restriction enzyme S subunit
MIDRLLDAIFSEMFGERAIGRGKWKIRTFGSMLSMPLRNGVSPSTTGTIESEVLTLSAVTGDAFDSSSVKSGVFTADVPRDKRVSRSDLLICRGNGNKFLVGRGFFPTSNMQNVAFPDTIIAARLAPEELLPAFIEKYWNSREVRDQIESSARTTNGTFKVNQEAIERVKMPVPPLELQRCFTIRASAMTEMKETMSDHLHKLDVLFASLQQHAFGGVPIGTDETFELAAAD